MMSGAEEDSNGTLDEELETPHKKTQTDPSWGCWATHKQLLSLGAAFSRSWGEPWLPCFLFMTCSPGPADWTRVVT